MLGSNGHASNRLKGNRRAYRERQRKLHGTIRQAVVEACMMRHGKDTHLRRYDERRGRHEPESIKTLMKNGDAERTLERNCWKSQRFFDKPQNTTYLSTKGSYSDERLKLSTEMNWIFTKKGRVVYPRTVD